MRQLRLIHLSALLLVSPFCAASPDAGLPTVEDTKDFETQLSGTQVDQLTDWGIGYEHGRGVKKNLTNAIKLLCKAARKEYALAQYELGWIYMNGRHGKRDLFLAASWFELAAANGDRHAKQLLRFIGGRNSETTARCLLPDGSVFPEQIAYSEPKNNTPNPEIQKIRAWVKQLAPQYGLQPRLVLEVIRAESNFNAKARSPKNACGLMQLIPATAKRFGVTDIWDPVENLKGGMAYLRWLKKYFNGDLRLTLAAYNAGEAAVVNHQGIPPYKETRRYVSSITRRMARAQRAL
jgi:hypothetical protein